MAPGEVNAEPDHGLLALEPSCHLDGIIFPAVAVYAFLAKSLWRYLDASVFRPSRLPKL